MRFPYGKSEPFLENELPYLSQRFHHIRIFPMFKEEEWRNVPDNVSVEHVLPDPYRHAGFFEIIMNARVWQTVEKQVKRSAPNNLILKKQRPVLRARLRQALGRSLALKKGVFLDYDPNRVVLYSYWNYDWALSLSILKQMDRRVKFVTRMLGFDMFKFRAPDGWPAFRTFQLAQADANYIISKAGMDHMLTHYGAFADQYKLAYLATHDHGAAPWSANKCIRLVSCANMVELKRIDLLVSTLGTMTEEVRWVHFGDGPERERLESLINKLPKNITVELKGSTANADILNWYKTNEVDMFIHTSSTEGGVPVALQEAASFGIPLIGTNAGGIPEIVTPLTGELVPIDVSKEELAEAIRRQIARLRDDVAIRTRVRAFWSERFRAEKVYTEFAEALMVH